MMDELISAIEEIVKYGLEPNLTIDAKSVDLEKWLVEIYSLYFKVRYDFDEFEYDEYDKSTHPNVLDNVKSNFQDFGWYHTVDECHNFLLGPNLVAGNATDDLSDIIYDLLEVKWRKENNSANDSMWFFDFIFRTHTKSHVIELLRYISDSKQ